MSIGWKDLIARVSSYGGSAGPAWEVFRDGIHLYSFPYTSMREISAIFHIGHDYAMGTAMYPHFHFTTNNNTKAGNVRIGFEYTLAKAFQQMQGSTFGKTKTVYVNQYIDPLNHDQYKHFTIEVSDEDAISGDGLEPDTIILMRVFRDANHKDDTYHASIFGITTDMHYQAKQQFTPSKRPDFFSNFISSLKKDK